MSEMKRKLEDKLDDANNLLAVQGDNGNWNVDPYMHGLYNGMEMILAIFEEREPKFKDVPNVWLKDLDCEPVEASSYYKQGNSNE